VIVLAREVFVCRCSTSVPEETSAAELGELARRVTFVRGTERELALVDPAHHDGAHVAELRERLGRGEHWMVGLDGSHIVTYTWLHTRPRIEYPYLPGCTFDVGPDVGYGYDAWTPPELRGGGIRRRAFREELGILKSLGKRWEASFFVKHQLEGAQRSLAKAGIVIEPLWRVKLEANRKLSATRLPEIADNDTARPARQGSSDWLV
jgi:hypothetical protein